MSLNLEDTIMREIGFGQHYTWHNGSGSCYAARRAAVGKLSGVIKQHADRGEAIVLPHAPLIAIVKQIAEWGEDQQNNQYVLTNTWQACATAIRAHMEAVHDASKLRDVMTYLREHYQTADPFQPYTMYGKFGPRLAK